MLFWRITGVFFLLFAGLFCCDAQQVTMEENRSSGMLEIRNGLLGIVVPGNNAIKARKFNLAPIQSFIYANGSYSDNTINYLEPLTPPVSLSLKIVKQSGNEISVRLEYKFEKKKVADPSFYYCSITVRKGEKSILIEEDTDNDLVYRVKISNGLSPDKARYRGWASGSKQNGYEPNGIVYRNEGERGYPMDATVDLQFEKEYTYPRLTLWEPAGGEMNTGRYWMVYNSSSRSNNLLGFFQGKPGRLIGAKFAGPALQTRPADPLNKEGSDAELFLSIYRRGPDNSFFKRKRFQWAVFISTKNDLLSPEKTQPISKALNRVSGLGAVIGDYLHKPVKIVSSFYKGAIYMPAENIQAICKRVKKDAGFYNALCQVEATNKSIFDTWRTPKIHTDMLQFMLQTRDELLKMYTEGEGTYDFKYRYWQGARHFKHYATIISCLFADPDNKITPDIKKKLEELIAVMARIVWDDNNVPLFDSAGINFGPANMVLQYRNNARTFFALLLANDPEFAARAKDAASAIGRDINDAIYENGASIGSPHYTQPSVEPILFSMLQLKQAGVADLFKTNSRVKKFARFYASLATPPSCRFSGNRKLISFGDGSEESTVIFGLLATGFQHIDAALSSQLLSLYFYGPDRYSTVGSLVLSSDLSRMPEKTFAAGSCNYTGYMSHFRSGVNTNNESAVWVLNGDRLYDHRMDDAGETAIYALQAPLSVAWSSFYYPHATDARVKSAVVPEQMFPQWKSAGQPIGERSLTNRTWPISALKQFAKLKYSASATVSMRRGKDEWYRKVTMISVYPDAPVIVFYDSTKGNEAAIWSMPMMSEGAVSTDVGAVTPVRRIHNNADLQQLPEATPVKNLNAGLHRFSFTGQSWKAHPSGGINWHLYTLNNESIQFNLAEWANTWQNDVEKNEFEKTNGRKYMESQQIIRVRVNRPFFSVILPYKKGADPYRDQVKQSAGQEMSINLRGDQMLIGPDYYYVKQDRGIVMGMLSDKATIKKNGWGISGGYAEIEYKGNSIAIRVHGNSGKRTIQLPVRISTSKKYSEIAISASGKGQLLTINYTKSSDDLENGKQGYTEYIFETR